MLYQSVSATSLNIICDITIDFVYDINSDVEMSDQSEERKKASEERRAQMRLMRHKRNWLRHTAMVPKGFIRMHVLGALNENQMSGSELMESIEKRTGGVWKPSPGSIYPLLSWLQDSGYVKELPTENGMKRYELTSSGKSLLKEQQNIMKKVRETMGFQQFPFSPFFVNLPPEKAEAARNTMRRAGMAMFQLGGTLQGNFS
jgi:DNA-binding PadR family transcriptional regulator